MSLLSHLHSHPLIQNVARVARELCVPVYLVGGAVRDALREVEHDHDFDFTLAEGFDELVSRFAREKRAKIIPWDEDQKRIVFRQGAERITVDFSRMPAPDIIHDLNQRDFTVNAMAIAVHENEAHLIDPLGGYADLSAQTLKMCSELAFESDPLRMLRAVRFARQLSCVIEPRTRERMRLNSGLISRSAQERIKREFFMILQGPSQERSLRELHTSGLLEKFLPDEVFHNSAHGDLTLERKFRTAGTLEDVLQQAEERLDCVRAHLENYLTRDVEDGVNMTSLLMFVLLLRTVSTSGHTSKAKIGRDASSMKCVQRISREIGLGRKAQHVLASLVENNGRILYMGRFANVTERMKLRFALDCEQAAVGVCLLAIADSLASGSCPAFEHIVDIAYDVCEHVLGLQDTPEPLLTGDDVMHVLGSGSGPNVGHILRQAAQLERDGVLQNREAALLWLKKQPNNA